MKKTTIFFLLFFPFLKAIALDCNYYEKYEYYSDYTDDEQKQCSINKYIKADNMLNKKYKKLMDSNGDKTEKEFLRIAQNKWIIYRDADCKFQTYRSSPFSLEDSPIYLAVLNQCMEEKTKQRVKEIDEIGGFTALSY